MSHDEADQGGRLDLSDQRREHEPAESETVYRGRVWDVQRDVVPLGDGPDAEFVVREYISHPGAVAIIGLDADDRVLLVQQYRHPVRSYLWEAPAGLLDVEDEHPLVAAKRELLEEAHQVAGTWHVLYDVYNSPGSSAEALRCYLARDLRPAPGDPYAGSGEERDMPQAWAPLDDLVARCLRGDLHNPHTITGVLATYAARESGWSMLRPPDAPWPERFPD
ncbi:MAG: NUDIX hydrolase [Actinomycetota bacterium]|nr:NUDIX hydrolase [Actinomycetota bacterium]